MLFQGITQLYLYICCTSVSILAAASVLDQIQHESIKTGDGLLWFKANTIDSSQPSDERLFDGSGALNDVLMTARNRGVAELRLSTVSDPESQDPLSNRSDTSINSIEYGSSYYSPSISPSRWAEGISNNLKLDVEPDELEKVEMHTNNHQSSSSNANHQHNHQSRLYAQHYPINHHHNSNKHLSSNSYGNHINLNYIHSLLAKPTSSNSLSSLLSASTGSSGLYGPSSNSYYSALALANLQGANNIRDNMISQQPTVQQMKQPQQSYDSSNQVQGQGQGQNQSSIDFSGSSMCGRPQIGMREPRIVGGNSTFEGEFPWAVSIQKHGNHHCGGVIVGRKWILTAAHCVRNQFVNNLLIRTGGHTLSRLSQASISNHLSSHFARDYLVDQIFMHDDFSRYDNLTASQLKSSANTNNADIALLRLKQEIHWNELALPVCFPSKESGNFSGHDAVVIGWGKLNEKSEDFSNELQKVKLTIIDNKVCQNWFRQAGREMPIDERIICAGFKNGGKDACHGDSGGPLLSKINGHYVIVGVVSTGIGCARPLLPGLYSRVSSYLSWIERHVTSTF